MLLFISLVLQIDMAMATKSDSIDVIFNEIKQKKYLPVYFLQGEEPYFIDIISNYIENNVLPESEKSFNLTILYGKDTDLNTVVSAAKRYPMMSERQVVILKEAQDLKEIEKTQKIKSEGKEIEINLLENYIKNPMPTTILVICYKYKKIDGKKSITKTLTDAGYIFTSSPMYDSQLPVWLNTLAQNMGFKITDMASKLFVENIGNNLSRIHKELEKITINLKQGATVEEAHVVQYVGISKEYNVYELQNAISRKDILKCNKIALYLGQHNKEYPIQQTLAALFGYFCKVLMLSLKNISSEEDIARELNMKSTYFAKEYMFALRNYSSKKLLDIFAYLRMADMQSKGYEVGEVNEEVIIKELIFKILH
ncbi:MAG: DNA polymerase III subunit delta [Cytophagales bacterium]|nr:DNA polymerase III subunit delta [Cytophagales bacterium]